MHGLVATTWAMHSLSLELSGLDRKSADGTSWHVVEQSHSSSEDC